MIAYNPTKCYFTQTDYNGKLMYALHTTLVNKTESLSFVIRLGEKMEFVKNIARSVDNNGSIALPLYLEKENFQSNIPFYIKEDKYVQCDNNGNPILHISCYIVCPKYNYGEGQFMVVKYNDVRSRFEYLVRRGEIIEAEYEGGRWCLPRNIKDILSMPPRYKTIIIPMTCL